MDESRVRIGQDRLDSNSGVTAVIASESCDISECIQVPEFRLSDQYESLASIVIYGVEAQGGLEK